MVITLAHNTETTALGYANDKSSNIIGRIPVPIPAMWIRFFLASNIIDERGFVGNVINTPEGYVAGTEMLGIVTTDIDVQQDNRFDLSSMLFLVTSTKWSSLGAAWMIYIRCVFTFTIFLVFPITCRVWPVRVVFPLFYTLFLGAQLVILQSW